MRANCIFLLNILIDISLSLVTTEPRIVHERSFPPSADESIQNRDQGPIKLHPKWEGDFSDLCIGAIFGIITGGIVSMAVQKVANAITLIASNLAFTTVVLKYGTSQGFITIHTDAIRTATNQLLENIRSLPIIRKLDLRRKRKEKSGTYLRFYRRKNRENLSFLHLLANGGLDQIEEIATRNEHAVLGVLLGFVFGILRVAGR
mmetsp:Transcript_4052/g.5687  ORF Transcript_4052/g.5687 Transcript_4052/m.5687 type:complete len:204 (-) Transcript_4052:56-667(-)